MYTTVTKVRKAAGLVGNTNISDSFISDYIVQAQSRINSYVGKVYALPLPKYYSQTIVFTGTGSGSGTLSLTINSVVYSIAVTLSMTATQAADAMRAAMADSTSFVVDGIGNGTTVTIRSIDSDDSTDVTISVNNSPQVGITATAGTVTEVAVPLIESLANQITTALLFIVEYGPESQDTDKDGYKLLALAMGTLKDIQKKVERIYDFADVELPRTTTARLGFFPTTTSQTDATDPTANRFTMNKKF